MHSPFSAPIPSPERRKKRSELEARHRKRSPMRRSSLRRVAPARTFAAQGSTRRWKAPSREAGGIVEARYRASVKSRVRACELALIAGANETIGRIHFGPRGSKRPRLARSRDIAYRADLLLLRPRDPILYLRCPVTRFPTGI